ncbi:hypothetical protein CK203_081295 [Vitis vinifera]|uniref:Uncharacterized protein n=1 Tax=Vitis vinifera TaxID=29760 RepID=A0A438DAN3_VITVI|nr:hypothetical protein CK203_081295 [Vitis vinifera]
MRTSLEKQPCQKLQNRVSGSGRLKTAMIMSWLINSMNNDIGENFLLFGTAKDIWDAAKETYLSSENTSELFQVESALHDFRQGEQSVTQYYNTLSQVVVEIVRNEIGLGVIIIRNQAIIRRLAGNFMAKPTDWNQSQRSDRDGRAHVAANSESTSVPASRVHSTRADEDATETIKPSLVVAVLPG